MSDPNLEVIEKHNRALANRLAKNPSDWPKYGPALLENFEKVSREKEDLSARNEAFAEAVVKLQQCLRSAEADVKTLIASCQKMLAVGERDRGIIKNQHATIDSLIDETNGAIKQYRSEIAHLKELTHQQGELLKAYQKPYGVLDDIKDKTAAIVIEQAYQAGVNAAGSYNKSLEKAWQPPANDEGATEASQTA